MLWSWSLANSEYNSVDKTKIQTFLLYWKYFVVCWLKMGCRKVVQDSSPHLHRHNFQLQKLSKLLSLEIFLMSLPRRFSAWLGRSKFTKIVKLKICFHPLEVSKNTSLEKFPTSDNALTNRRQNDKMRVSVFQQKKQWKCEKAEKFLKENSLNVFHPTQLLSWVLETRNGKQPSTSTKQMSQEL